MRSRSPSADGAAPRAASARPVTLKARALMLLARREHSRSELRAKLLPLAELQQREIESLRANVESEGGSEPHSADQRLDALLAWLEAHGYLSDQRFVESRVHARSARYGNLRIRHELATHGVTLDEAADQQLRDSEFERAQQAWQRKFDAPPQDLRERARQTRFLSHRGFSADVIQRVLRGSTE